MNLKGRCVVVTGGKGRLGQVVIQKFIQSEATVVCVDRPSDRPSACPTIEADLTNQDSVQAAFGRIRDKYGGVDILIHLVGMWSGAPFVETTYADWKQMLDVNLNSAFLCFREAVRQMQDGNYGRIIGIASGQGVDRGAAEQAAYSASKAGVMRLVEAVAGEYSGSGITVHALAPSMILYEGMEDETGVTAQHLADLCMGLCGPAGAAINGEVVRAYGTRL